MALTIGAQPGQLLGARARDPQARQAEERQHERELVRQVLQRLDQQLLVLARLGELADAQRPDDAAGRVVADRPGGGARDRERD